MEGKEMLPEQPEGVLQITDANFEEATKKYSVIVVDFWAEWCMPCKMLAPTLESLAAKHKDKIVFGKLNVDENPSTPAKFNIMSIPTLVILKSGKIMDTFIGVMEEKALEEKILDAVK